MKGWEFEIRVSVFIVVQIYVLKHGGCLFVAHTLVGSNCPDAWLLVSKCEISASELVELL